MFQLAPIVACPDGHEGVDASEYGCCGRRRGALREIGREGRERQRCERGSEKETLFHFRTLTQVNTTAIFSHSECSVGETLLIYVIVLPKYHNLGCRGICFHGTLPPQNDGLRLPLAHKRRAVGSCLLLNAVGGTVTGSRLMLGKGIE